MAKQSLGERKAIGHRPATETAGKPTQTENQKPISRTLLRPFDGLRASAGQGGAENAEEFLDRINPSEIVLAPLKISGT